MPTPCRKNSQHWPNAPRCPFKETGLFNDGGNFVDDYAGNVVISRKFLRDNKLSEPSARNKLRTLLAIKHVAFIEADEQGGLEHADGVVSFVDTNTLIINSYPDDPEYARKLIADLRRGLPGVKIHQIITPYDGSKIHDGRFGSACGLYTNALVTPERIYFPQFGIPADAIALKQLHAVTRRQIVPVASRKVCFMGGGVRCMSLATARQTGGTSALVSPRKAASGKRNDYVRSIQSVVIIYENTLSD